MLLDVSAEGLKNFGATTKLSRNALVDYFTMQEFDAATSLGKIAFITDPFLFATPADAASPINHDWYSVNGDSFDSLQILENTHANLLCAVCDDLTNPCQNNNTCATDGTCSCDNGAFGTLCRFPPISNGHCDAHFNSLAFNYDGGDCCEATCVSTTEYKCGYRTKTSDDPLSLLNIGFPNCISDLNCSSGACWGAKSASISLLSSTNKALLQVSENGRILVAADPTLDIVQVFDVEGSLWKQRGTFLEGTPGSQFGRNIALWTPPGVIVSRRFGNNPLLLAIAFYGDFSPGVRVVHWEQEDSAWHNFPLPPVCQSLSPKDCKDVDSLAIGMSGGNVTLAVGIKGDGTYGTVSIFTTTWDGDVSSTAWEKKVTRINGTDVTMSTKGDFFAIKALNRGIIDRYKLSFGSEPVLISNTSLDVFGSLAHYWSVNQTVLKDMYFSFVKRWDFPWRVHPRSSRVPTISLRLAPSTSLVRRLCYLLPCRMIRKVEFHLSFSVEMHLLWQLAFVLIARKEVKPFGFTDFALNQVSGIH